MEENKYQKELKLYWEEYCRQIRATTVDPGIIEEWIKFQKNYFNKLYELAGRKLRVS